MNDIEKRISNKILKFREVENLNPLNSTEEEKKFLSNFVWEGSILNEQEKRNVEQLLVKYHDVFARH